MQVLFSALYAGALALIPYIRKLLFDGVFSNQFRGLLVLSLLYFLSICANALFQYISQVYEWKTEMNFNLLIKKDLFHAISFLPYKNFKAKDTGEYLSILNNDISVIENQYLEAIIDIIKSVNMLIIYGIVLFVFIDYRIATVILIASLISVFAPKLTANRLSKLKKEQLLQTGKYMSRVKDLLEGFKLINSKTRTSISEVHDSQLGLTERTQYKFGRFRTFSNVLNGYIMDIISLSAFVVVGLLLYKNEISIGTGIATFGYIESFIYPIKYILNDINSINSAKETKEGVLNFLEQAKSEEKQKVADFHSDIVFDGVTVVYPEFKLDQFSYVFQKGKKYAIIGHSASGKSTIINLLMNYISPSEGKILIDGKNHSSLDLSQIVYCVHQHEHLFADSFDNNATIFRAFPPANVYDAMKDLNMQNCNIQNAKDAQLLSGGEKQMLAAIRMMAVKTPILLLDEPYSAMDPATALTFNNNLLALKDHTIILVTHNLTSSQLKDFDEILVMRGGKLEKTGNYETIINSDIYPSLIHG